MCSVGPDHEVAVPRLVAAVAHERDQIAADRPGIQDVAADERLHESHRWPVASYRARTVTSSASTLHQRIQ